MPSTELSWPRWVLKLLLGLLLLTAGTGHLTFARQEFRAQVPDWVPMEEDTVVLLSGVAELALGAALVALRGRAATYGGLAAAVFFVLVFPGNVSQYVNQIDAFGLDTDGKRLARLFFQPLFVLWALWSTEGLKFLRSRFSG
ncbi:hypothetical protein Mal64_11850 [Pseudobythopirellula maris]|uniref:DoxX n=1 Tax=Pseudobythopirellula maris TaxID=2527991 RepID=A0A5C5ZUQ4_9BACT|nr:hypothetical protein [Pseudobythopirellula maris]TWT90788.1 hypothetical protein Mal64_11850 [Pseudobythopirellula maris]